ncbi:enoyl-CoA hydratase-related protein [Candidatus Amarobacter glycogenicus]|uniref:enoyl-CoA hydratase/isomerase family protein n=1 Tax=Candidatus Amarobacter glycogenicus TaxID=3140699 RepID=UPI0031355514|nr:hypothetical protein [Dehalococcoidia bacterium]MCC6267403.1 hypothetical protein [Dehalococcoidia bacterium]
MTAAVAELSLLPPGPLDEWLPARIESILAAATARAVLIDAAGAPPDAALSAACLRSLLLFELPVVFAFEGALAGGLAEIALAADIRVCSESASLRGPLASSARACTLADEGTALALFLGREALSADALLAAGLVSSLVPAGQSLAEGRRVAATIASRGPIATRLGKEAIWRGLPQPIDQALRFETDLTLLLQTTKDRAEGVRAFLEKRAPIFTGE